MKKHHASTKKKILLTAVAVLVVLGVIGLYVHMHHSTPVASGNVSTKRYSGPTPQDKADSEAHKNAIVQQLNQQRQQQQSTNTPTKTSVTPIITNASQNGSEINVSGYVSGVFENGGTCTVTLTQAGSQITKTSAGFENASTTQCTPVTIERSEFSTAGQWQTTLTYESANAAGISQAQTLTIQ